MLRLQQREPGPGAQGGRVADGAARYVSPDRRRRGYRLRGAGAILLPDKAHGLSVIFLALAGIMLLTVPLAFMIPDTAHERRMAEQQSAQAAETAPT